MTQRSPLVIASGQIQQLQSGDTLSTQRELLTANRSYFVRTDGSDSNTGLANTSGAAFLTIQQAINVACGLDLGIFSVTINVADGTYTGANTLGSYLGVGPISIVGNTSSPGNVIISTTSANCFSATAVIGEWVINGMKCQTTTAGTGIAVNTNSFVRLSNLFFGTVPSNSSHILVTDGGIVIVDTGYTISGGAGVHLQCTRNGSISKGSNFTVTLTGTPAFSTYAIATVLSIIQFNGATFSGSATGTRYAVNSNSVIDTNGAGANYFPGSGAGSAANGGLYL